MREAPATDWGLAFVRLIASRNPSGVHRLRPLGLMPLVLLGLLSSLATGGGDAGDGGGGVGNTPPRISNLVLSRESAAFMEGGGRTSIQTVFDYSDPEADLVTVRVEISDGSSLIIPIPGPLPGSSGGIVGSLEFATDAGGIYTAQVWVVDSAGNSSNRLTATFTILGSTQLSALRLSAATLDQPFDPALTSYTATVPFSTSTTTIRAECLDRGATLTVNGHPVDAGTDSLMIDLTIGENILDLQVTSGDGGEQATYAVTVRRRSENGGEEPPPLRWDQGTWDDSNWS
jgi:hypothetical protein